MLWVCVSMSYSLKKWYWEAASGNQETLFLNPYESNFTVHLEFFMERSTHGTGLPPLSAA